jgi:hypothetical protein
MHQTLEKLGKIVVSTVQNFHVESC